MRLPSYTAIKPLVPVFEAIQRELSTRVLRVVTFGEWRVAWGSVAVNGAGTRSGFSLVNHGLGKAPVLVLVSSTNGNLHASWGSPTATNFVVQLTHIDNITWSSDSALYWLAIG